MTEEEKAAQKAKPVATTPSPGTPWYVGYLISKVFFLFIYCHVWLLHYYTIGRESTLKKVCVKY